MASHRLQRKAWRHQVPPKAKALTRGRHVKESCTAKECTSRSLSGKPEESHRRANVGERVVAGGQSRRRHPASRFELMHPGQTVQFPAVHGLEETVEALHRLRCDNLASGTRRRPRTHPKTRGLMPLPPLIKFPVVELDLWLD